MDYAESAPVPKLPSATPSLDISSFDDLDGSHRTPERQNIVRSMLRPYESVWSGSLGQVSTVENRIDVQREARPLMVKPYRARPAARQEIAWKMDNMLNQGVTEPAQCE